MRKNDAWFNFNSECIKNPFNIRICKEHSCVIKCTNQMLIIYIWILSWHHLTNKVFTKKLCRRSVLCLRIHLYNMPNARFLPVNSCWKVGLIYQKHFKMVRMLFFYKKKLLKKVFFSVQSSTIHEFYKIRGKFNLILFSFLVYFPVSIQHSLKRGI